MATMTTHPDQDALKRVGAQVRARLETNPQAQKIATDVAEIYALPLFLNGQECFRLMQMIDVVAQPSSLYAGTERDGFRTSYSGNFTRNDPFVQGISARIDNVLGIPDKCGETFQGQRYLPGQQFKPHHDFFHTDQEYWKQERKRGGQRSWTAMIFLNQVEEGGATQFVEARIGVKPNPGTLLVWNNASPDGAPNHGTLHAGTPVVRGVKYVITKWYRTRPWK